MLSRYSRNLRYEEFKQKFEDIAFPVSGVLGLTGSALLAELQGPLKTLNQECAGQLWILMFTVRALLGRGKYKRPTRQFCGAITATGAGFLLADISDKLTVTPPDHRSLLYIALTCYSAIGAAALSMLRDPSDPKHMLAKYPALNNLKCREPVAKTLGNPIRTAGIVFAVTTGVSIIEAYADNKNFGKMAAFLMVFLNAVCSFFVPAKESTSVNTGMLYLT